MTDTFFARTSQPVRRVLTYPDLRARKGIKFSRQHIDRKIKGGTFPPSFHFPGSTTNHWFEDVIDGYLVASAEGRDWRETETEDVA